jgi:exosome complex RNA-binding protein Csl4
MNDFKILCKCGSTNGDIFSCEQIDSHVVEIIYICKNCGHTEKRKYYLYT